MIQARQLTKWYGPILALDRIDLDVPAGRIVGFLGPNGAGKTTAIRMLTGYMPPSAGTASINGHDVLTDSLAVRASIGYLPENTPLYPEMRVREQLHYFGKVHGLDRAARRRRIGELTDRCGLEHIVNRPIGQLSKGNRQRVGLAMALLHDPPVLILDEPTVGLDPAQITAVRQLIRDLAGRKTILLSTHILPEVEKTCQEVVIIASGRIVASGTPEELTAQARRDTAVLAEVKAGAEDVRKAIAALPGVQEVQTTLREGWTHARVRPAPGAGDIRPALAELFMNRPWLCRDLRPEIASLEELFIQVTSEANVEAA